MLHNTNELVTKQQDLGFDIFPVYQTSCYSFSVPTFEHLYDEYKIAFLLKETNLTSDQIKGSLSLVNQQYYQPQEVGIDDLLRCRQEPEYFDFLIASGYSFSLGKEFYHFPLQEVW